MIDEIVKLINAYWKFDEQQQYLSTWHDKQDLIDAVMKVKNCNAPAVSVTVCDGCENKSLCKKHGVLGINCIRLNVKQTER